jgi:hypothetical protein
VVSSPRFPNNLDYIPELDWRADEQRSFSWTSGKGGFIFLCQKTFEKDYGEKQKSVGRWCGTILQLVHGREFFSSQALPEITAK